MTSFHNIWLSKLHILYSSIEAISLLNFIGLGCLDQILRGGGGWKTLPSDLHALKKPSPYRVKQRATICNKCCMMFYEMFNSFARGLIGYRHEFVVR